MGILIIFAVAVLLILYDQNEREQFDLIEKYQPTNTILGYTCTLIEEIVQDPNNQLQLINLNSKNQCAFQPSPLESTSIIANGESIIGEFIARNFPVGCDLAINSYSELIVSESGLVYTCVTGIGI